MRDKAGGFLKVDYPVGQQDDNRVMREPQVLVNLLGVLLS